MKAVMTFESFTSDRGHSVVTKLEAEIASSQMRVGPSMDKLPWAMETVVYEFIKDRIIEANSSSAGVDIDSIINQLEQQKEEIKQKALEKLKAAGMEETPAQHSHSPSYKVLRIKDFHLTTRLAGEPAQDKSSNSPVDETEKEFRTARNKGRNILRKVLHPETWRQPKPEIKHNVKPELTVQPIDKSGILA